MHISMQKNKNKNKKFQKPLGNAPFLDDVVSAAAEAPKARPIL